MSIPLNFQHLPQISLSKLYHSVLSSKTPDPSTSCSNSIILGKAHHNDIHIQSPFYERHEVCKGPCTCAYHRMKRYKQIAGIVRYERYGKMKDEIQRYKIRIADAVRAGGQRPGDGKEENSRKYSRKFRHTEKESILPVNKQPDRPARVDNLDNYNYFFEQILKKRLQPIADHQKVSNLLKFIKITSTRDPSYLKKMRDYIHLNLLKIVQKIPFDRLLEGDNDVVKKIAVIANLKPEQAAELLRAVQKGMEDMRRYLVERAGVRLGKEEFQEKRMNFMKKNSKSQHNNSNANNISKNQSQHSQKTNKKTDRNRSSFSSEGNGNNDQQQSGQHNDHIMQKLILNGLSKGDSPKNGQLSSSSRRRGGFIHSKRSNLSKLQLEEFMNMNQEKDVLHSGFKDEALKQKSSEETSKNNINTSQNPNSSPNNSDSKLKYHHPSTISIRKRDSRAQAQQQQQDNYNETNLYDDGIIKNKRKSVRGRKKGNSKIKIPLSPFNCIDFSTIMSKEEFGRVKYLLGEQNNPISQDERLRKLFNLLQRRISQNPQFFDQFLQKFGSVLTPQQIQALKQKHSHNEFKKMLQKLTKQVDLCLEQLKHSDQLIWRQQQEQDYTINAHKTSPFLKNTLELEYVSNNEGLIDQFNRFKIVEKCPPPALPVQEPMLSQKEIGEMFLEEIMQMPEIRQRFFKEKAHNKKESNLEDQENWGTGTINEQKHRQILRYVRKKYPTAFTEIKQNIKDTLQAQQHS